MSNVDDEVAAAKVVELGALLCVTKSMIMGILGCLWQFQLHKKTNKITQHPAQERELISAVENNPNIYNPNSKENPKSMKSSNSGPSEHDRASFKHESSGGLKYERATLKRKGWTEWTLELHGRFMAAAKQLGQGSKLSLTI